MPALSDVKFDALRVLGHTGAMSDMTLQWLQAGGATSDSTTDAWVEMLAIKLTVPTPVGVRNDDWFAYLRAKGYTGTLNDMELAFWVAGGVL
jgi:hypothetical protein